MNQHPVLKKYCINGDLKNIQEYPNIINNTILLELFIFCCNNNQLEILKWIYSLNIINIDYLLKQIFEICCKKYYLEIIIWLHSIKKIKYCDSIFELACDNKSYKIIKWINDNFVIRNYNSVFNYYCTCNLEIAKFLYNLDETKCFIENIDKVFQDHLYDNNLEFVKWIYSFNKINIHDCDNICMKICCTNDDLEICKWLYSIGKYNDDEIFIWNMIGTQYINCLRTINHAIAKYIYSLGKVSIQKINYVFKNKINVLYEFNYLYKHHNEIIYWLYSLGCIDIHVNNEEYFRTCCKNGNLEIIKWIISLGNINIHAEYDEAFGYSCVKGYLQVAKYIYSLDTFDDLTKNKIFIACCKNGKLTNNYIDIILWLYSTGGIDIHVRNEELFRISCCKNDILLAKTLYSLDRINIRAIKDDAFISSCKIGHIDIAKWLASLCSDYIITQISPKIKFTIIEREIKLLIEIDNPKKYAVKNDNCEDCLICLTKEHYMIKLSCMHWYCIGCFKYYMKQKTNQKCCYCQQYIDVENNNHALFDTE